MKTITIGRNNTNNIVINDSYVSGQHLIITLDDNGKYFLQDLNSSNGTYVNGKKISQIYLDTNDVVKIGNYVLPWQSYFEGKQGSEKPVENQKVERKITFGRSKTNNVVLASDLISAEHAVIEQLSDGTFRITDLDSTNGTYINDRKVEESIITTDDRLRLANTPVNWYDYFNVAESATGGKRVKVILSLVIIITLFLSGYWVYINYDIGTWLTPSRQSSQTVFPDSVGQGNLSELAAYAEQCVFMVETKRYNRTVGSGTGFFVRGTGIGISNYHVFREGHEWIVKTIDGQILQVDKVLNQSRQYDFVIFKVRNPGNQHFPYLPLAAAPPRKGDDIFVVGNPLGIESTLSKGVVSALREVDQHGESFVEGDTYIQFDAAISPGSSGSPVMNMAGEVVGVATLKIMECENCNFAINIKYIKPHLE